MQPQQHSTADVVTSRTALVQTSLPWFDAVTVLLTPATFTLRLKQSPGALQGKKDPEVKRKTIGAGFIEVFRDFAITLKTKHGIRPKYLVQVN